MMRVVSFVISTVGCEPGANDELDWSSHIEGAKEEQLGLQSAQRLEKLDDDDDDDDDDDGKSQEILAFNRISLGYPSY